MSPTYRVVTPDGRTWERASSKPFTHVVAVCDKGVDRWNVDRWSGSEAPATKAAGTLRRKRQGADVRVLPCEVALVAAPTTHHWRADFEGHVFRTSTRDPRDITHVVLVWFRESAFKRPFVQWVRDAEIAARAAEGHRDKPHVARVETAPAAREER